MTTNPGAKTDRTNPDPVAVEPARPTSVRVLAALALVALVAGAILLFADIRAGGVDCGSPVSPTAAPAGRSGGSDACEGVLGDRRVLAWVALGASGVFAVGGCGAALAAVRADGARRP